MDIYNEEFLTLIKSFNKYSVKYILVGGLTTNFHGYKRSTGDIDFWIEGSIENRKNLIEALDFLDYGRFDELQTMPLLAGFCEIMLDNGIYADLMDTILGFEKEDFNDCYENAVIADVDGVQIRFLHYNHLIRSKENSHRLKDRLDVEELRKINLQ
jgi:Nucleotidyl transferase of unknown function (DUF2204)